MKLPRVGIIGARRSRQGLGPFVARFLKDSGAEVACFLATGPQTLEASREALRHKLGIEARGYLDLDVMLRAESPAALAILSPPETHRRYLEAALEAGLAVLCEKPFVWGEPDLAGKAREIASGFEERRLKLWENCPWPYTLPSYERLFPGVLDSAPGRFEMRLSPVSSGKEMLGDAMPHAISMLQALAPSPSASIADLRYSTRRPEAAEITAAFGYRAAGGELDVEIRLVRSEGQPREAGYGADGHWARRTVKMEGYTLGFEDGTRNVPVPDPLALLIGDFVRDLASTRAADGARARLIAQRMALLDHFVGVYEGESH